MFILILIFGRIDVCISAMGNCVGSHVGGGTGGPGEERGGEGGHWDSYASNVFSLSLSWPGR